MIRPLSFRNASHWYYVYLSHDRPKKIVMFNLQSGFYTKKQSLDFFLKVEKPVSPIFLYQIFLLNLPSQKLVFISFLKAQTRKIKTSQLVGLIQSWTFLTYIFIFSFHSTTTKLVSQIFWYSQDIYFYKVMADMKTHFCCLI